MALQSLMLWRYIEIFDELVNITLNYVVDYNFINSLFAITLIIYNLSILDRRVERTYRFI